MLRMNSWCATLLDRAADLLHEGLGHGARLGNHSVLHSLTVGPPVGSPGEFHGDRNGLTHCLRTDTGSAFDTAPDPGGAEANPCILEMWPPEWFLLDPDDLPKNKATRF